MSSPVREAEKRALRWQDAAKAELEFLVAGGRKVCGTCLDGHRCPVGPDDEYSCWVWQGWEGVK